MSFIGQSPRFKRVRNIASTVLTIQTDDTSNIVISPNKVPALTVTTTSITSALPVTIQSADAITFNNTGNTFGTSLTAGSNTANLALKLPIADGSSGYIMQTNGSGQLSFVVNPGTVQATATVLGVVQGGTVPGSSAGTNPAAGYLGRQVSSSAQNVTVPTSSTAATVSTIASISLTAGIWNISATYAFTGATSTTYNWSAFGISANSAATPTPEVVGQNFSFTSIDSSRGAGGGSINPQQYIVASTATFYLVACVFAGSGTSAGNGTITATLVG